MERELRRQLISESDQAVDQTATDVVYGAAKWAKDGMAALGYVLLFGLGVVVFICFIIAAMFGAVQAISAPLISVAIVSFIIWVFLLRAIKKTRRRFERKTE